MRARLWIFFIIAVFVIGNSEKIVGFWNEDFTESDCTKSSLNVMFWDKVNICVAMAFNPFESFVVNSTYGKRIYYSDMCDTEAYETDFFFGQCTNLKEEYRKSTKVDLTDGIDEDTIKKNTNEVAENCSNQKNASIAYLYENTDCTGSLIHTSAICTDDCVPRDCFAYKGRGMIEFCGSQPPKIMG